MRAGYTLLSVLNDQPAIYDQLERNASALAEGLKDVFVAAGKPVCINRVGSMVSVHFSNKEVTDFVSAAEADNDTFRKYFHYLLTKGIYLPPSPFETWFISHAITEQHIEQTVQATKEFLKST
jgi:glutamate-1-semialdehyde 2,1-aminomutase